jgi:hypothetical protein
MVQCLGYFACFSFFFYMKMYVMSRKDENCFHESFEMQIFIDSTLIASFPAGLVMVHSLAFLSLGELRPLWLQGCVFALGFKLTLGLVWAHASLTQKSDP